MAKKPKININAMISLRLEIEVPKLKSIFLVIFVILKNKQKTKQKQISKIEETNILIEKDRKSTRLNSSHLRTSRMPSSA